MRLFCEIKVNSRLLPTLNIPSNRRGVKTFLAIGKNPGKLADSSCVFLHLCTAQDTSGTRYKIVNNIQAVFTKFIAEGKFTIQLKEPPLDLCVKAEPKLASMFLSILKRILKNETLEQLPLSHLNPVKLKQFQKRKSTLHIFASEKYPYAEPFPYNLTSLYIRNINMQSIENRIINLKYLTTLDVTNNKITELPFELSNMNLSDLNLHSNCIDRICDTFFNGKIGKSLKTLDLSNNKLEYLPHSIVNCEKLCSLYITSNKLRKVPYKLGALYSLQNLKLDYNNISCLPASFLSHRMNSLDTSCNPFNAELGMLKDNISGCVKPLKEMAALVCIHLNLKLQPCEVPSTLCDYIKNYFRCICGKILIDTYIMTVFSLSLRKLIDLGYCLSGDRYIVPSIGLFCSIKCLETAL